VTEKTKTKHEIVEKDIPATYVTLVDVFVAMEPPSVIKGGCRNFGAHRRNWCH
jgi:hypothetical protein